MSKTHALARFVGGITCGLLAVSLGSGGIRQAARAPAPQVLTFAIPGGEPVFAMSLSLPANILPASRGHDLVILFDTSASQAGEHRRQALAVLESCLANLDPTDRVRLVAIDTQVKGLSSEFAAPQSAETQSAFAALQQRVPLGATNLQFALETGLQMLQGERPRSLIYIGDGMSTGKLLDWTGFRSLVQEFRRQQIPVSSYAIGPRTDLQVLGILAQHTGGVVMIDAQLDDTALPAPKVGCELARAAEALVFYADELAVQPSVERLVPGPVPPLRADRQTIVLGLGTMTDSLEVTAWGAGRSLSWKVTPGSVQAGGAFLAGLWQQAEQSDGLLVATAGSELLNVAREEFADHVRQLLVAGRRAVAVRDLQQAEQFALAVRQIDPANVEAETIFSASRKIRVPASANQVAATSEPPLAERDADDEQPPTAKGIRLIDEERKLRQLRGQVLQTQVDRTLDLIGRTGASDPEASLATLKRTLRSIVSSTDVDPDLREKMRAKVTAAIDRLGVALNATEMARISAQERVAAVKARDLAAEYLVQRDEQLEQLIRKVSALLYEGYIGNANAFEEAEAVARNAFEQAPYAGVTSSAIFTAEAAGQLDKAQRLRYRRYDQILAALYQCELSHIPFPDEPPIVYPAPEVWKSLTERRKKWKSVDLMRRNPAEEKLYNQYDRPTNVDWSELPLEDCVTYLAEFHGINIILDKTKMTEEGVALDQPITLKLQGVSLRSVLKLLLEPLQLTYIIENEVLKITTSASAADKLSTRVYPVADLVIPIITPRAGRGMMGMMGGGMGGGGMGMGGGGMGGMGMGGGGMGGMGMGGMGMFSIPDVDPDAPQALRSYLPDPERCENR